MLLSRQIPPPLDGPSVDAMPTYQQPEDAVFEEYWKSLEQAGATDIHLAGSGPALFAPVDSEAAACELQQGLLQQGYTACFVSNIIS